jgi:hypothetical protein
MTDGKRRIMEIVEITGIEENVVQTQTVFKFEKKWIEDDGAVIGSLEPTGYIPSFLKSQAERSGHDYSYLFKKKESVNKKADSKIITTQTVSVEQEKKPETIDEKETATKELSENKPNVEEEKKEVSVNTNEYRRDKIRRKKGGRR